MQAPEHKKERILFSRKGSNNKKKNCGKKVRGGSGSDRSATMVESHTSVYGSGVRAGISYHLLKHFI